MSMMKFSAHKRTTPFPQNEKPNCGATIRTKLLKIGALVKSSVRRVVCHLAGGFPMQDLFRQIAARLTANPLPVFSSG